MSSGKAGTDLPAEQRPSAERLESWKEIAAYLKRGVRTVQRWEKEESLPVQRHLHDKLGTVYAYRSDLDAWWHNRRPHLDAPAPRRTWRRVGVLSGAGVLLAGVVLAIWWASGSGRQSSAAGSAAKTESLSVRRVWTDPNPALIAAVSPDGRYLSMMDYGTKGLAIVEMATGRVRSLAERRSVQYPTYSAISPDGKRLAYAWFNEDFFFDLRVIGTDGRGAAVLCRDPQMTLWPFEWSRDGLNILALSFRKDRRREIVLVRASDGALQVLKTFQVAAPTRISFSSDQRFVAYDFPADEVSGARDIYLLAATGGVATPLVQHPAHDSVLGWVPDSRTLLFVRERTGAADVWAVDVDAGKARGAPHLVKENVGPVRAIGFAQNRSYYYSLSAQFREVCLATLDPATGQIVGPPAPAKPPLPAAPVWSPNGQELAYVPPAPGAQPAPGRRRIVIRRLADGSEHVVDTTLEQVGNIRWFPDGLAFVAEGSERGGGDGLYRIDAQTGRSELLVERAPDGYVGLPMVAADGKTLFYKRIDWERKLYRIMARVITTGVESERFRSLAPLLLGLYEMSPDGRDLAYMTSSLRGPEVIHNVAAGGQTKVRELLRLRPDQEMSALAWTPRGDALLVALVPQDRGGPSELWRVPVKGGPPENLGVRLDELRSVTVSPDGRRLALVTERWKSEVWEMRGFLPHDGASKQ